MLAVSFISCFDGALYPVLVALAQVHAASAGFGDYSVTACRYDGEFIRLLYLDVCAGSFVAMAGLGLVFYGVGKGGLEDASISACPAVGCVHLGYAGITYMLNLFYLMVLSLKNRRGMQAAISPVLEVLPVVTVQLPIFNEWYVAERLLDACAALDYPRRPPRNSGT